jgi:hypothetical protein
MTEMHVCVVTTEGRLMHTIRRAGGSWLPFANVAEQNGGLGVVLVPIGLPGGMVGPVAASTTADGELHLCAAWWDGRLLHTLRRADGSWLPFGFVEEQTGDISTAVSATASTAVDGELHLCVVTTDGRLLHTIRRTDGSWLPFGDVEGQTGPIGAAPAQVRQATASATVDGELQVCAVTTSFSLVLIVRRADGAWVKLGDVEALAGDIGVVQQAAASATANGELHVCAVAPIGQLWHTIRRGPQSWFRFGDVEAQAGSASIVLEAAASATADGNLHVCTLSMLPLNEKRLMHTIRRADGSWLPFDDVETQTGDIGETGSLLLSVAISGS